MRIRKPFAGAFLALCAISGLAGFTPPAYNKIPQYKESDKALHFLAFFLLTTTFYWIIEANRRRVLQITFLVCTFGLGVASEVIQSLLPIDRAFDYQDIVANLLGSGLGLGLCNWYHKRMLERKRAARGYGAVAGDEPDDMDVELGEGIGGQESGVVRPTVDEELANWDENAEDWDSTEPVEVVANGQAGDAAGDLGVSEGKKRYD
ncbi:VanZ like family protein [Massariosphaeria phaeospora]|uniref:VanZ like family protein n=1 Tax=Massariosphaeria phaeospora TaxID=100035 RepID=A0A7C8IAF9_9PLEO|nr:VanZ like family protein [Massariosphaeria phaeospora]